MESDIIVLSDDETVVAFEEPVGMPAMKVTQTVNALSDGVAWTDSGAVHSNEPDLGTSCFLKKSSSTGSRDAKALGSKISSSNSGTWLGN
ncbi:unnamed protein product [Enterobius vermicularis]|uniref:Uncharacterized protein n=1 Tax=Enterobius vermicularis TaxID=51028 RepID=A0A0N4V338_ENTVE|nr:unnamed protein product [Enterobius vermicularis]